MNKHDCFLKLSAHAFTYMNFKEIERFNKEFGRDVFISDEFIKKRVYKEVNLNNDKDSKNTFEYIDQFVNNVVQTRDTINGLKIHFNTNSTYNEFIEVLNIFTKRNAELYILDHNTMYFLGRDWNPKEEASDISCGFGTFWENDNVKGEQKFSFKKELNNLKIQFQQNKIIYSSYILFFVIGIVYTFKKK